MKSFRITSWTTHADTPDVTFVVASVLSQVGPLNKTENYEFSVPGRYDSITPDFESAVESVLREAGVL